MWSADEAFGCGGVLGRIKSRNGREARRGSTGAAGSTTPSATTGRALYFCLLSYVCFSLFSVLPSSLLSSSSLPFSRKCVILDKNPYIFA